MRITRAISNRLPPLSCAFLVSSSVVLTYFSSTTCEFLKISYTNPILPNEDGFIVTKDEIDTEFEEDKSSVGIFCQGYHDREGDLMWNLSWSFQIATFAFMSISLLLSWGLSLFVKPTFGKWKTLSVVSLLTAGLQIPCFLMYLSDVCRSNGAKCSAGKGFFMCLWSIIMMICVTVLTQFFDYPSWRYDMDFWKVDKDGNREMPLFDYEDAFDIEEPDFDQNDCQFEAIHQRLNHGREKQDVEDDCGDDDIHDSLPVQELGASRWRRWGKKDQGHGKFHMLQDAPNTDIASQCLSGMSCELPLTTRNYGLSSLLKEAEKDEHHDEIEDEDETDEQEDYTETRIVVHQDTNETSEDHTRNAQITVVDLGKDDDKPIPPCSPGSPRRRKMKKGKDVATYMTLEDDDYDSHDESHLIFTTKENDNAKESTTLTLMNKIESKVEESNKDIETNKIENDADMQSTISSNIGDQVQIFDMTTGNEELLISKLAFDCAHSESTNTQNEKVKFVPVVSDDEKDDDEEASFETSKEEEVEGVNAFTILDDLENDAVSLGFSNTRSRRGSSVCSRSKEPNQYNKEVKEEKTNVLPSDEHLANLLAKFTDQPAQQKFSQISDKESDCSGQWHDVLDGLNSDNDEKDLSKQHLLSRSSSTDFEDAHEHLEMMKALQNTKKTTPPPKKEFQKRYSSLDMKSRQKVLTKPPRSVRKTHIISHVVVSDAEDDTSSIGAGSAVSRRYLYPDEVEV